MSKIYLKKKKLFIWDSSLSVGIELYPSWQTWHDLAKGEENLSHDNQLRFNTKEVPNRSWIAQFPQFIVTIFQLTLRNITMTRVERQIFELKCKISAVK